MAQRGANTMDFPRGISGNTSQPYMILTSYESKNAIESTGQTGHGSNARHDSSKIMSSIALYIPPNSLTTTFDSTYENAPGAATKAAMGTAWDKSAGTDAFLWAGLKGGVLSGLGKLAETADKQSGMLAAQGIAVNNHMALVYKGPSKFRTHSFVFNFFPKNKGDADVVVEILKDFQNGMLPRIGGAAATRVSGRTLSAPYFKSPRHWTIDFFNGFSANSTNDYLFQIGKSVITNMTVNHDPNSTISFHKDGSPVQTTLTLGFQEIELQTSSDTDLP